MADKDSAGCGYIVLVASSIVYTLLGIAGVIAGSILIAENYQSSNITSWGGNSTSNSWWNEPYNEQCLTYYL
ncbi:unnamed protein product [Dibothriocephalus latus]|uniref:Uncharacterized protein n=1 Tax=Dibothriocephalus latus TaxID=60516 RepID=A0A3P7LXD9_DIBLA|nr:unnamed protein product [Dibothriocephalus latus]